MHNYKKKSIVSVGTNQAVNKLAPVNSGVIGPPVDIDTATIYGFELRVGLTLGHIGRYAKLRGRHPRI